MNKQDKANMEEIYKTYSNQLYKYLFCLTRNESLSEELSQETFCIAYERIKKFRGECKLFVLIVIVSFTLNNFYLIKYIIHLPSPLIHLLS